jgi:hypothetical protein
MALGPAQVHSEEHLSPVGGFCAAGSGADRQQGVALVVLAAEEKLAASAAVVGGQLLSLRVHVGENGLIVLLLGQLEQLERGSGARLKLPPQPELLTQSLRLAQELLGRSLIVPESGFEDSSIQLG